MIEYLQAAELMKGLGMDNSEFLSRAKFVEGVKLAIERKEIGFRGDWVSSAHIVTDIHPKQWAVLMGSIGYVLHPSMIGKGRSDVPVDLGGGNKQWVRLFVKQKSPSYSIKSQGEAIYSYKVAQNQ